MLRKAEVIVIGAGPAGSSTAKEIAKKGKEVYLIEKDEYPGQTNICAGGIPRALAKELNNKIIEKHIFGHKHYFPWGMEETKYQSATVYRWVFDKFLAEDAEKNGAILLTSTKATDVFRKDGKIVVVLENQLKQEKEKIETKIVVFADGPNTLAYRKFNIGFKPDADKTVVSMVCEIEWKDNPLNNYEFYYDNKISPWGYGWIFPKKDTVNVGVGCLYSKMKKQMNEYLTYLLHRIKNKKLRERKILWFGSALLPFAPANRIFSDNILVVGDAAGMIDPISGGGIMHAIDGGKIAGEVSIKALEKNNFSKEFLSQYQKAWEKTDNYKDIYLKYRLSNIFLYLSKMDKNAYSKLVEFNLRRFRDIYRNIRTILR